MVREDPRGKKQLYFGLLLKGVEGAGVKPKSKAFEELLYKLFFCSSLDIFWDREGGGPNPNLTRNFFSAQVWKSSKERGGLTVIKTF